MLLGDRENVQNLIIRDDQVLTRFGDVRGCLSEPLSGPLSGEGVRRAVSETSAEVLETAHPDTLPGGCPDEQVSSMLRMCAKLLIRTSSRDDVRMSSFEQFRGSRETGYPDTLSGGCPDERF